MSQARVTWSGVRCGELPPPSLELHRSKTLEKFHAKCCIYLLFVFFETKVCYVFRFWKTSMNKREQRRNTLMEMQGSPGRSMIVGIGNVRKAIPFRCQMWEFTVSEDSAGGKGSLESCQLGTALTFTALSLLSHTYHRHTQHQPRCHSVTMLEWNETRITLEWHWVQTRKVTMQTLKMIYMALSWQTWVSTAAPPAALALLYSSPFLDKIWLLSR